MNVDDFEMVEPIREGNQKARKVHRCNECLRVIQIGELYYYTAYTFEGELGTHKLCRHCQQVTKWLRRTDGGWVYKMVEEDLEEHLQGGGRDWRVVARLLIGMQRKWARFDGKGLMDVKVTN